MGEGGKGMKGGGKLGGDSGSGVPIEFSAGWPVWVWGSSGSEAPANIGYWLHIQSIQANICWL